MHFADCFHYIKNSSHYCCRNIVMSHVVSLRCLRCGRTDDMGRIIEKLREVGSRNITVNCVAPGPVDTEMSKLVHTVAIRSEFFCWVILRAHTLLRSWQRHRVT